MAIIVFMLIGFGIWVVSIDAEPPVMALKSAPGPESIEDESADLISTRDVLTIADSEGTRYIEFAEHIRLPTMARLDDSGNVRCIADDYGECGEKGQGFTLDEAGKRVWSGPFCSVLDLSIDEGRKIITVSCLMSDGVVRASVFDLGDIDF